MESDYMGRPKGSKNNSSKLNSIHEVLKRKCLHCSEEKQDKSFYKSHNNSDIYLGNDNYIPVCKDCIKALYEKYRIQYINQFSVLGKTAEMTEKNEHEIEKLAIKRLCMAFDIYYSDLLFEAALRNQEKFSNLGLLSAYMKMTNLRQSCKKSYDNTILEEDLSQELLKSSMVGKIGERYADGGLYQNIYDLCLKLMESLRKTCNVDFNTND